MEGNTPPERAKITVLVSARKNSKFLAKFLAAYSQRTIDRENTQLLVMYNQGDEWNEDFVNFFERHEENAQFFNESLGLGRAGLHVYFNQLLESATGDWIIYFCEDHYIVMDGWDDYLRHEIETRNLDPTQIWSLIPKFDNVGAMNQMVSRGYIEALGGVIARHGWLDSYLNDLNARLPQERVILMDLEMFHDFTHDQPSMLDDSRTLCPLSEEGERLKAIPYNSGAVRSLIDQDAEKLNALIQEGK